MVVSSCNKPRVFLVNGKPRYKLDAGLQPVGCWVVNCGEFFIIFSKRSILKIERTYPQMDVYSLLQNVILNPLLLFFSCDAHSVCSDLSPHATHPMGRCVTSLDIPSGRCFNKSL